jgi:hypothetical protein
LKGLLMSNEADKKKTLSLGSGKLTLGGVTDTGTATAPAPPRGAPPARTKTRGVQVEVVRKRQTGGIRKPATQQPARPRPTPHQQRLISMRPRQAIT